MAINTKRVTGRRDVRYGTLDDALTDLERLLAAGPVQSLGNWTPAMNIDHVAMGIEFDTDGYPPETAKTPWLLKLAVRLIRRRILTRGFGAGINPAPEIAKAFAPDPDVTIDAALQRLKRAIHAARQRGMTQVSPLFGPMTPEQHEQFNCRHAELHFSFIVPV